MSPVGQEYASRPERQEDVAFIGVFHGEGPARLERLYRSVRPWFATMVVALQGPTDTELELTSAWADVVIEHPTMGYCEWSFNAVYAAVRERGIGWTFNLDGDELADPTLLGSLGNLIRNPGVMRAGGARFYRRNVFTDWDGQQFPSFSEETGRLLRSEATREPLVHSHSRGTKTRPPLSEVGSIWQFRHVDEFLTDHQRYLSIQGAEGETDTVTREYLTAWYRSMRSLYNERYIRKHTPETLLEIIDQTLAPEKTW